MPHWLQHLLAISLALGCLVFIGYQTVAALRAKRSQVGSCCERGCASQEAPPAGGEKIAFIPADQLRHRR